jgi:probable rRNA maturation factor
MAEAEPAAAGLSINIMAESTPWKAHAGVEPLIRRALWAAAEEVKATVRAEVTIVLADDALQRHLNRKWRGKDVPTNVLSFPAAAGPVEASLRLLGDVVLAFETVRREADEESKALDEHVAHLVVHGFLHLLGYSHENDADAEAMERLETRIMTRLGFDDPNQERSSAGDRDA